jgi:hypothetical protein
MLVFYFLCFLFMPLDVRQVSGVVLFNFRGAMNFSVRLLLVHAFQNRRMFRSAVYGGKF